MPNDSDVGSVSSLTGVAGAADGNVSPKAPETQSTKDTDDQSNAFAKALLRSTIGLNVAPQIAIAEDTEKSEAERLKALQQFAPMAMIDPSIGPVLVTLLDDESSKIKNAALSGIALRLDEVAKTVPEAVDKVIALTRNKDQRALAIEALTHAKEAGKKAIPELTKQLETEKKTFMINKLVTAIGKQGTAAKSAIPVFQKIVKENRGYAGKRAAQFLKVMEGK